MLTVVERYRKICPAIGVGTWYRGSDVVQALEQASHEYGLPTCLRVDNGPEFVSQALDFWAYSQGVQLDFSRPGTPTDKAFIEAFNRRFRQECLNQHWFLNMVEAKVTIEAWRQEYNRCRPHGALGDLTPLEFLQRAHESSR